jgi:hypothetical protein
MKVKRWRPGWFLCAFWGDFWMDRVCQSEEEYLVVGKDQQEDTNQ